MHGLNSLITAAMQLAGTEDQISHNARLWQMEGGRACPLEWGGCSQPVYVDIKTGEYDYGQPGGPGHADCMANCHDGYWCLACGRFLPADEDGVIMHDNVPHPKEMTFDEEERPQ